MFYIIVLYYIVWSYLHNSYQSNIMDINSVCASVTLI